MGYRKLIPERIATVGDCTVLSLQNAEITVDTNTLDCLFDYTWRYQERQNTKHYGTNVPDGRYKTQDGTFRYIRMSRILCGVRDKPTMVVHVYDGDGTNMRMNNLLVTSRSIIEKSKPRVHRMSGIAWNKHTRLWQAYANLAGKSLWCGSHATTQDAVAARDNGLLALANKYRKELAIPDVPITRFLNEHMKERTC